ncbi:MAG TPA: flavodoxin family protein [Spirochaetia bacterium]|nr:flavodoxin family protein [Spirochaetia bacterium]
MKENATKRKKVLIVLGSPRARGNSATLGERVAAGVRTAGGNAELIRLHGMDLRPCRACDACQRNKDYRCVQRDGMRDVYHRLQEADALVIASPVYWFTMSAQTKLFMDRLYAFIGPQGHGMAGKKVGVVLTYQDADPLASGAVNAIYALRDAFGFMKAPLAGTVYGSANAAGEVRKNKALMDRAFELGRNIVSA